MLVCCAVSRDFADGSVDSFESGLLADLSGVHRINFFGERAIAAIVGLVGRVRLIGCFHPVRTAFRFGQGVYSRARARAKAWKRRLSNGKILDSIGIHELPQFLFWRFWTDGLIPASAALARQAPGFINADPIAPDFTCRRFCPAKKQLRALKLRQDLAYVIGRNVRTVVGIDARPNPARICFENAIRQGKRNKICKFGTAAGRLNKGELVAAPQTVAIDNALRHQRPPLAETLAEGGHPELRAMPAASH